MNKLTTCVLALVLLSAVVFAATDLEFHNKEMIKRMDQLDSQVENISTTVSALPTAMDVDDMMRLQEQRLQVEMDVLTWNLPTNLLLIFLFVLAVAMAGRGWFSHIIVKEKLEIVYIDSATGLKMAEHEIRRKQAHFNRLKPPTKEPKPPAKVDKPPTEGDKPKKEEAPELPVSPTQKSKQEPKEPGILESLGEGIKVVKDKAKKVGK